MFVIVMTEYMDDPKEIINLGLTCRDLHDLSHRTVETMMRQRQHCLEYCGVVKPHQKKQKGANNPFMGLPHLIERLRPSHVPCLAAFEACLAKDARALERAQESNIINCFEIFMMGTHERLGVDSPVSILGDFLLSNIYSIM